MTQTTKPCGEPPALPSEASQACQGQARGTRLPPPYPVCQRTAAGKERQDGVDHAERSQGCLNPRWLETTFGKTGSIYGFGDWKVGRVRNIN